MKTEIMQFGKYVSWILRGNSEVKTKHIVDKLPTHAKLAALQQFSEREKNSGASTEGIFYRETLKSSRDALQF